MVPVEVLVVRMKVDRFHSPDGINPVHYEAGKRYEVPAANIHRMFSPDSYDVVSGKAPEPPKSREQRDAEAAHAAMLAASARAPALPEEES